MAYSSSLKKIIFIFIGFVVLIFSFVFVRAVRNSQDNPGENFKNVKLVVYANSSFVGSFGPGEQIKSEFEKICHCTVEYVDVGTSIMALERMKLDPQRRVDVILGLDHLLLNRAAHAVEFQEINRPKIQWSAPLEKYVYPRFIPYDWSPMGFVYNKNNVTAEFLKSKTLKQALQNLQKKSISLVDPTLSPVGLEFMYWLFAKFGLAEAIDPLVLALLRDKAHSYSPSWSTAYGLFKNKQTSVTFSYLTSLVYHWHSEKDFNYQFLELEDGHPMQIEYAAVPNSCWNCGDAKEFIEFMTRPQSQKMLAEKNYMLPVLSGTELNEIYNKLARPKILSPDKLEDFARAENQIINSWAQSR